MKRAVGGLVAFGGWVIVPSVGIWLLGGPLWTWVAIVGGLGVVTFFFLGAVALLGVIANKYGFEVTLLGVILSLGAIALTQALGFPWWAALAALGVLAAIPVGLLGFKWLVDE